MYKGGGTGTTVKQGVFVEGQSFLDSLVRSSDPHVECWLWSGLGLGSDDLCMVALI